MMEVVVTTGAIRCAKAPVKMSSPTNRHPVVYRPDALPVAQPTVSKTLHYATKKFSGLNETDA